MTKKKMSREDVRQFAEGVICYTAANLGRSISPEELERMVSSFLEELYSKELIFK